MYQERFVCTATNEDPAKIKESFECGCRSYENEVGRYAGRYDKNKDPLGECHFRGICVYKEKV